MDDIQEQQDIATEISDAISNPVGFGADVDEDELLAELDELEQVYQNYSMIDGTGPEWMMGKWVRYEGC